MLYGLSCCVCTLVCRPPIDSTTTEAFFSETRELIINTRGMDENCLRRVLKSDKKNFFSFFSFSFFVNKRFHRSTFFLRRESQDGGGEDVSRAPKAPTKPFTGMLMTIRQRTSRKQSHRLRLFLWSWWMRKKRLFALAKNKLLILNYSRISDRFEPRKHFRILSRPSRPTPYHCNRLISSSHSAFRRQISKTFLLCRSSEKTHENIN